MKYNFFLKWELGLAVATALAVVLCQGLLSFLTNRDELPTMDEWSTWFNGLIVAGMRTSVTLFLAALTKGAIQATKGGS